MSDPLSEIVRAVNITGGVFLEARFTAPWAIAARVTPDDCSPFLDVPAQVIAYHIVTEGRLTIELDGAAPTEVDTGEIIILPRNDSHILTSAFGLVPVSSDDLILQAVAGRLPRIEHGGGGAVTRIVCGFLAGQAGQNPLIATLPRLLKLDVTEGTSRDWIEASVQFAARELVAGRLASSAVMAGLSELLFVEAVRSYAASRGDAVSGWLRGLRDPKIGKALTLIHGNLAGVWTVELLARSVAMSRSAFVQRFTSLVGLPPIKYLTTSRLQSARFLLRDTAKTVAQVAHEIGYESEVAFNRAFKREFGTPPAQWRRRTGHAGMV